MNEQELIQALKSKFGKIRKGSQGWISIPCPTCLPKNRNKLKRAVSPYREFSTCWICNNLVRVSDLLDGVEFTPLDPKPGQESEERVFHPLARIMPGKRFIPLTNLAHDHPAIVFLHKDYLFRLDDYYKKNDIVYCPSDGGTVIINNPYTTSADRLIFPVKYNNKMVGWQMRSIPGTTYGDRKDVVRYIHLFDKGNYLYNYDNAKEYESVVVVEGVKKALKFPNGISTLGKCMTSKQLQLIQEWKKITIMLDGDTETQSQAQRITDALNLGPCQVVNINLSKYGIPSPDEATEETLAAIIFYEWNKT